MASSPYTFGQGAGTTSQAVNPYVQFTNSSPSSGHDQLLLQYVDARVDGLRSEMKGEIATLAAAVEKAETQRSADYAALKTSIDAVRGSLPSKNEMWKIVGTVTGGGLALLGLLWGVFGAGASLTGSFADKVLERKEAQSSIQSQLSEQNKLLKELQNDHSEGSPRDGKAQ